MSPIIRLTTTATGKEDLCFKRSIDWQMFSFDTSDKRYHSEAFKSVHLCLDELQRWDHNVSIHYVLENLGLGTNFLDFFVNQRGAM